MRKIGLFSLGLCLVGCSGITVIGERNSSGVGGSAGANTQGDSPSGQGATAANLGGTSNSTGWNTSGATVAVGGVSTTVHPTATGGATTIVNTTSGGSAIAMGGVSGISGTATNGGAATGGAGHVGPFGGNGTTVGGSSSGGMVNVGGSSATGGSAGAPIEGGGSGIGGGATVTGGAPANGGFGGTSTGVKVNLDQPKQTMAGFGISDTWAPAMSDSEADALFSTTRGIGLSILRVSMASDGGPIGSNVPADITKAKARGVNTIIGTLWSPPANCKSNASENDGGHLLESCYESFTTTIAKFAKDNGLYAMSPQNEPDFASCGFAEPCNGNYPTALYTADEMMALVKAVGPKLKAAGVKVIAPEPAEWLHLWSNESATGTDPGHKNSTDPLKCGFPATNCAPGKGYDYGHSLYNDKDAWAQVDIIGTHQYDTQVAEPWPSDVPEIKPLWVTEMSGLKWWPEQGPSGDIQNGIAVAGWIHDALVNGNASAWIWWWYKALNNDDNESLILFGGADTKRHYTLGNYSRFIRPGYTRVDVGGSTPTDVLLSAYKGTDGTVVVVAINKSDAPAPVRISIVGGTAPASMKPWVTSALDDLHPKAAVPVSSGSFAATLDGKTVTTFVSSAAQLAAGGCPPCIADAIAACPSVGDCNTFAGSSMWTSFSDTCFENGVRVERVITDDGILRTEDLRTTRDGSACYSIHTELGNEARTVTVAAGTSQIARGTFDQSGQAIIDCGVTPYVLEDTCGTAASRESCTLTECP